MKSFVKCKRRILSDLHRVSPWIHGWRSRPLNPEHLLDGHSTGYLWIVLRQNIHIQAFRKTWNGYAYTHCRIVIPSFLLCLRPRPSCRYFLHCRLAQAELSAFGLLLFSRFLLSLAWCTCTYTRLSTRMRLSSWKLALGCCFEGSDFVLLYWCLRSC